MNVTWIWRHCSRCPQLLFVIFTYFPIPKMLDLHKECSDFLADIDTLVIIPPKKGKSWNSELIHASLPLPHLSDHWFVYSFNSYVSLPCRILCTIVSGWYVKMSKTPPCHFKSGRHAARDPILLDSKLWRQVIIKPGILWNW